MERRQPHHPNWAQLFSESVGLLCKHFLEVVSGLLIAVLMGLAAVLGCIAMTPVWTVFFGTLIGVSQLVYVIPMAIWLVRRGKFFVASGFLGGAVIVLVGDVLFLMLFIGAGVERQAADLSQRLWLVETLRGFG